MDSETTADCRHAWVRVLALGFLLFAAGCETPQPRDPKDSIPDWNVYANGLLGFYFQYPPILDLEVEDRDLDGTEVAILYPGMRSVVFKVYVLVAAAEPALLAKRIQGTDESCRVGPESGLRFKVPGRDGTAESRTLLKKDGWIFVFEGSGKTFSEILAGFRFGTPPPPPEKEE